MNPFLLQLSTLLPHQSVVLDLHYENLSLRGIYVRYCCHWFQCMILGSSVLTNAFLFKIIFYHSEKKFRIGNICDVPFLNYSHEMIFSRVFPIHTCFSQTLLIFSLIYDTSVTWNKKSVKQNKEKPTKESLPGIID